MSDLTREIGRRIAEESKLPELNLFDQQFFRYGSVQLRIPLRSTAECIEHLRLIEECLRRIRAEVSGRATDKSRQCRSALLTVETGVKLLNRKINAKRSGE